MTKRAAAKTRVSNTGSNSQTGFSIGVDWLTYTHDALQTGAEVDDIIRALETLAGDQIDFATNRPRLDNHKTWAGSGRSEKGLLLWFNPARSSDELLLKSVDGNLVSHPGLLPPGHHPLPEFVAENIRASLPDYAALHYDAEPVAVYDPIDGSEHQHHGYSIVASADGAIEQPGELRVSMSARYLNNVKMDELAAYLTAIKDVYGLRCSRMDVALDDHEKRIPLELVEKARRDRNYFNVRSTSVVVSDNVTLNTRGKTIYFGSRQSEAMLRAYDKTVESKGKILGNRWEAEFHDRKANKCLADWLAAMAEDVEKANRLLKDVVIGLVDFRDRSQGDKNRLRCPLLKWFEDFCELLEAIPLRLRVARPVPSMQRTVDYLKKSVAPSLASAAKVLGVKFNWFLKDLLADGEARMTNQRRKMIADTDAMELCY